MPRLRAPRAGDSAIARVVGVPDLAPEAVVCAAPCVNRDTRRAVLSQPRNKFPPSALLPVFLHRAPCYKADLILAFKMMKFARPFVFAALFGAALVAQAQPDTLDPAKLKLGSASALVIDPASHETVYAKSPDDVVPIASITKLMTAMVVLDSHLDLDTTVTIDKDDFDYLKGSRSRLRMGTELTRRDLLQLALMASENRAASALARSYPGGTDAFVAAMNAKARSLGMTHTSFHDSTGLTPLNVSTAHELAIMVGAAAEYPLIRTFTTTPSYYVEVQPTGRVLGFNNSNRLVGSDQWDIKLQKTGFINEAGRCLVMMAEIAKKPFVIVLLDSVGKYTRIADANRVKYWLETGDTMPTPKAAPKRVRKVKGTIKPVHTASPAPAKHR